MLKKTCQFGNIPNCYSNFDRWNIEWHCQSTAINRISTQVLLGLLRGYSRPYDKIMEMVNQVGYLVERLFHQARREYQSG
jgi:hypothetical protein